MGFLTKGLFRATHYGYRSITFKSIFSRSPIKKEKLYPLTASPIAALRERGSIIMNYSLCPVCEEATGGERRSPKFECPDCGFPTHCSKVHWKEDAMPHSKICSLLRQVNLDEHDVHSGRPMLEFEFPGPQGFEESVNLSNWDTLFYTRKFRHLESERSIRHVSKVLTYPVTIASFLHQSSPFKLGNRLTSAGMWSLAEDEPEEIRIFIPGARGESMLPISAWQQLSFLFPNILFHLHFIGPEARLPAESGVSDDMTIASYHPIKQLKFTKDKRKYEEAYEGAQLDPYTDIFFLFSPGFGHPVNKGRWKEPVQKILDSKCVMVVTGYDEQDMQQDVQWMESELGEEMDWVAKAGENQFRSQKAEVNNEDPRQIIWTNWGVWAVRGKRFEVIN